MSFFYYFLRRLLQHVSFVQDGLEAMPVLDPVILVIVNVELLLLMDYCVDFLCVYWVVYLLCSVSLRPF